MATRIGIISDTHIPSSIPELWPEVEIVFKDVDLILHAGDLITTGVVDWLERIAPTYAAEGNHDYGLSEIDERIRPKWFLDIEGYRLGDGPHHRWLGHPNRDGSCEDVSGGAA